MATTVLNVPDISCEYRGRTIAFCVPSCKKQFLAQPDAYLVA